MNIIFLIPPAELNSKKRPVDRVYGCNYGYDYKPAIHLLLLATIAKQIGCQVKFLDCPAQGYSRRKFIDYLKKNSDIDIVVFFTVWLSKEEDLLAAGIICSLFKQVKIIFTGAYPTWKPEYFLRDDNYIVARGEPEEAFFKLISAFKSGQESSSGINGISFLKGDEIIHNRAQELADINTLPVPDRRLISKEYYFNRINVYPATVMCTCRGCFYRCTYCAPHALDQAIELEYQRSNLNKPPLRLRSAEAVIQEFKEIAALGYRGVEICDNQFLWDKERMARICQGIRHLKLKWICCVRADYIKDRDLLRLMKDAGCELIFIGTESFSQEILDDINKEIKLPQNYRAVNLVRECGIEPEISVLLGASGLETKETALHSISEAKKLKCYFVHYSIALPLPNTGIYKAYREKGWMEKSEFTPLDNTKDGILNLPYINTAALRETVKKCYLRQYLSLRFIIRQLLNLGSASVIKQRIKAFLVFFKDSFIRYY